MATTTPKKSSTEGHTPSDNAPATAPIEAESDVSLNASSTDVLADKFF
jgi:hypothetical protein